MMKEDNLPLIDLFTRLREAGLPLGIGEYQLVLRALQVGFGIPDQAALARLCRLLWVKSVEESRIFDYHFAEVMQIWQQGSEVSAPTFIPQSLSRMTDNLGVPFPIPEPVQPVAPPSQNTDWAMTTDDEVQVAQSLLQMESSHDNNEVVKPFLIEDEYFPVTRRQMKQSWRYLRRPTREGPRVELDVNATINNIERQGMLLEPVLIPRRLNRVELMLLIDHNGSMVPFHILAHRLIETSVRGGRLSSTNVFYFHNCPVQYLFQDPTHQHAKAIQKVLERFHQEQAGAFIFSDAGAARGTLNLERVRQTKIFIDQVKQRFRYVVWLNPVPRSRWVSTTAHIIAHFVPMFDVSRRGLDTAIGVLRGRPLQNEV